MTNPRRSLLCAVNEMDQIASVPAATRMCTSACWEYLENAVPDGPPADAGAADEEQHDGDGDQAAAVAALGDVDSRPADIAAGEGLILLSFDDDLGISIRDIDNR